MTGETREQRAYIERYLKELDAELRRLDDEDEFRSDPTFLGPR